MVQDIGLGLAILRYVRPIVSRIEDIERRIFNEIERPRFQGYTII